MYSVLSFRSKYHHVLALSGAGIRYCGVPGAHYNLKLLTFLFCFTIRVPIAFRRTKAAAYQEAAAEPSTITAVFLLVKRVRLANYRLGLV